MIDLDKIYNFSFNEKIVTSKHLPLHAFVIATLENSFGRNTLNNFPTYKGEIGQLFDIYEQNLSKYVTIKCSVQCMMFFWWWIDNGVWIFNLTLAINIPSAFIKYISHVLFNLSPKNRLTLFRQWMMNQANITQPYTADHKIWKNLTDIAF